VYPSSFESHPPHAASARRVAVAGDALRARGRDEEALVPARSPAGLDLGPSCEEEIAVAILAELVGWSQHRTGGLAALEEAVDW
jgi:xanthine/CO dehydrogenase XdhC/CoxF family maturation factor